MVAHAQTPYDSFVSETSRPILELASTPPADTVLCSVIIDAQQEL